MMVLPGCGSIWNNPLEVTRVESRPKIQTVYPRPDAISTKQTEFIVLSDEFPDRYANAIELYGAMMCVSPRDYENIATNMQELLRWVNQAQYVIDLYERDRKADLGADR